MCKYNLITQNNIEIDIHDNNMKKYFDILCKQTKKNKKKTYTWHLSSFYSQTI